MDKLSSMQAFVKVAEANSFSRAASQLGVGCAAVTRSISGLERQLGVRLMERTTRRISLTPAGAAYLECCRNVLAMIEAIESDLAGEALELTGTIRIALSNLHGNHIFGPLLVQFAKLHPGIRFEIRHVDAFSDAVAAEVDIALLVGDERRKAAESVSLGMIGMQLVAAPDYLVQHGWPGHPSELAAHRCLNLSPLPDRPIWRFIEQGVETDYPINPCLNTRSGEGLLEAALSGMGLASLPAEAAAPHLRSGRLEPVLQAFPMAPIEAALAVSSGRLITHRTKALSSFIAGQFAAAGRAGAGAGTSAPLRRPYVPVPRTSARKLDHEARA